MRIQKVCSNILLDSKMYSLVPNKRKDLNSKGFGKFSENMITLSWGGGILCTLIGGVCKITLNRKIKRTN